MTDFSKGRIYKILNTITHDVYVGSTCQLLSKRFWEHKYKYKYDNRIFYKKVRELGVDNFYIELIENYPCSTREELRAREGKWIRDISTLNKLIAGRDSKEYYNDNAEMLRQKRRTYYHENKETENEKKKKYMEINFEKMKEKRGIYNEKNRDTILEKKKHYHITHKQVEQEYAKKRYEEEGKLKIECECGCVVTKCNLTRHAKTKLHTQLMTQKANPQD